MSFNVVRYETELLIEGEGGRKFLEQFHPNCIGRVGEFPGGFMGADDGGINVLTYLSKAFLRNSEPQNGAVLIGLSKPMNFELSAAIAVPRLNYDREEEILLVLCVGPQGSAYLENTHIKPDMILASSKEVRDHALAAYEQLGANDVVVVGDPTCNPHYSTCARSAIMGRVVEKYQM
jgi:hypothetical protein